MHCISKKRGSLCKTIADCIWELRLEEEFLDLWVKLGAADAIECNLAAECSLELHTDDAAHKAVHMLVHPCECAALLDSWKNAALVDLLDNQRHCKHCSRLHDLERLHEQ